MTTTWLMGKDGQGGMPIAIQKQIENTALIVNNGMLVTAYIIERRIWR